MSSSVPCTRHDQAGTDDPILRAVLAEASRRAGRNLDPLIRALYNYDGQLLATWRDPAAREVGAEALTGAWQERMGETRILHLVPTEEDYDYQEDVVDNGADE